jgi:hypothetical protein
VTALPPLPSPAALAGAALAGAALPDTPVAASQDRDGAGNPESLEAGFPAVFQELIDACAAALSDSPPTALEALRSGLLETQAASTAGAPGTEPAAPIQVPSSDASAVSLAEGPASAFATLPDHDEHTGATPRVTPAVDLDPEHPQCRPGRPTAQDREVAGPQVETKNEETDSPSAAPVAVPLAATLQASAPVARPFPIESPTTPALPLQVSDIPETSTGAEHAGAGPEPALPAILTRPLPRDQAMRAAEPPVPGRQRSATVGIDPGRETLPDAPPASWIAELASSEPEDDDSRGEAGDPNPGIQKDTYRHSPPAELPSFDTGKAEAATSRPERLPASARFPERRSTVEPGPGAAAKIPLGVPGLVLAQPEPPSDANEAAAERPFPAQAPGENQRHLPAKRETQTEDADEAAAPARLTPSAAKQDAGSAAPARMVSASSEPNSGSAKRGGGNATERQVLRPAESGRIRQPESDGLRHASAPETLPALAAAAVAMETRAPSAAPAEPEPEENRKPADSGVAAASVPSLGDSRVSRQEQEPPAEPAPRTGRVATCPSERWQAAADPVNEARASRVPPELAAAADPRLAAASSGQALRATGPSALFHARLVPLTPTEPNAGAPVPPPRPAAPPSPRAPEESRTVADASPGADVQGETKQPESKSAESKDAAEDRNKPVASREAVSRSAAEAPRSLPPTEVQGRQQNLPPQTVAPPASEAPPPEPSAPAVPARPHLAPDLPKPLVAKDIRLEVGDSGQRIQLRLTEQGGEVKVAVRTPDTRLSADLRDQLPSLSSRLEQSGFRAEAWHPPAAAHEGAARHIDSASGSGPDESGEQGRQAGGQERGEDRQRRPKDPEEQVNSKDRKEFSWFVSSAQQ